MSALNRNERKDEEYADYHLYLDTPVWPAGKHGYAGEDLKDPAEMAPQYAAAALAKLVRWSRHAPVGEVAMLPDEDTREDAVRRSTLGTYLVARAANLDPEHFYGMYGEYGSAVSAELHQVLTVMAVAMGDGGLEWPLLARADLAAKVINELEHYFRIVVRNG